LTGKQGKALGDSILVLMYRQTTFVCVVLRTAAPRKRDIKCAAVGPKPTDGKNRKTETIRSEAPKVTNWYGVCSTTIKP